MSIRNLFLSIAAVAFFAGCSPETVDIEVASSDIEAARNGSAGSALVTAVYDCSSSSDIKKKFGSIKKTALPYLGEGSDLVYKDDKITAYFKVPVVSGEKQDSYASKSIALLVLNGEKLSLKSTTRLDSLSAALQKIDASIEPDLKAGKVTYIVKSASDAFVVGATAVFVESKAYVDYSVELASGESTAIVFRCSSEDSVYNTINPYISVGFTTDNQYVEPQAYPQPQQGYPGPYYNRGPVPGAYPGYPQGYPPMPRQPVYQQPQQQQTYPQQPQQQQQTYPQQPQMPQGYPQMPPQGYPANRGYQYPAYPYPQQGYPPNYQQQPTEKK